MPLPDSSSKPLPATPADVFAASELAPSTGTTLGSQAPSPFAVGDGKGSVFDVCHVGVVLRATAFVEAVVVLGALLVAPSPAQRVITAATGSLPAMAGSLLWLVSMCALRRPLSRGPAAAQWLAAMGLGSLGAAFGWALLAWSGVTPVDGHTWGLVVLIGAALAGLLFYWLQLRARAQLPADTLARFVELQSRIQPHFLFNTLNTAIALVRVDPGRAESVLEDLAELFRVALVDTGRSVSLADEVQLAQRYLAIEQIRYGDRLQIEWALDEAAGRARVPSLLLQPLIENAVRHGIDPAPEGGRIHVRTRCKGGQAIVDIVNTKAPQPSTPGHGMALDNVRERLRLLHDVAAEFKVHSDEHSFRVRLAVPL